MSIHKRRRKTTICHNCRTALFPENNYCPSCGQENHDLKVPIGHLAFEVFEGFTHFDTKFYNSMRAIFLYPGKITKDFLEGRRGRYVAPVRLYFLISFVFFLGLNSVVDMALSQTENLISAKTPTSKINKAPERELQKGIDKAQKQLDSLKNSKDTVALNDAKAKVAQAKEALKLYQKISKKAKNTYSFRLKVNMKNTEEISIPNVLDEMNLAEDDTLRVLIENLPAPKRRQRLIAIQKQIIADSINTEEILELKPEIRDYFTEVIDKKKQIKYSLNLHALKNNAKLKIAFSPDTQIVIKGSEGNVQNTAYLKKVLEMSDKQLDSLNKKSEDVNLGIDFLNRGFRKNLIYYQLAFNKDREQASNEIAQLFLGIFSVMMFILMPIVAFLLKIIYSKRTHSIFTFPIRLFNYLWDIIVHFLKFRKIRKHRRIPHLVAGHTRYYYEHLIFSIHIHSVFFLMLIIFVGIGVLAGIWQIALGVTMLGFFVYFIISLKTVYRQGVFKTLLKSFILFFLYIFSFMMVLVFTGIVKFALA